MLLSSAALALFSLVPTPARHATTYYVATDGNDSNPGTLASPFATIQRAQEAVKPGDTVFLRGGIYRFQEKHIARTRRIWAYVFDINRNGTRDAPIKYWAYENERPVLDFSAIKPKKMRVIAFYVSASWIHFKGFDVTGVQVTIKQHTQSECFRNVGSNNIYERLSMYDGQAIGVYWVGGSNNLILNCDAYRNFDFTSEDGKGVNVDGFGGHMARGSTGNVFRGCRAWFNSDDGFDCINSEESIVFENCWAFYNGYSTQFASLGDGSGFKIGGYGSRQASRIPDSPPQNTVRFCLAVRNKANGFYANHHIGGNEWFNNTAYRNKVNFNMLERLRDNTTDVPGTHQIMRNNLGYKGRTECRNLDGVWSDVRNNYFNLALRIDDDDFVSLDENQLMRPRQADGSLPAISFLQLSPDSDLIDRGVDIGLPFKGKRPDLGAFER